MRTRSASKRPAQEKIEEAVEPILPKSRDKRKGKLKSGLHPCDSVDNHPKESAVKEEGQGKHEGAFQTQMDWEDGDIPALEGFSHDLGKEVTIEFTDLPSSSPDKLKRTSRRLSPEEKACSFNRGIWYNPYVFCLL